MIRIHVRKYSNSTILRTLLCAFTLAFYIGAFLAPDLSEMIPGLKRIVTSPAVLTKDYFFEELGSISGSLLNYGLVGTLYCSLMFLPGAEITGSTVYAFFLTIGFCSYGMNILNVLPFLLGVFVYAKVKRQPFVKFLNFTMFTTGVAPLISEVLFRYPSTEVHAITWYGVLLALLIGVVTGLTLPTMFAHMPDLHLGFDLYNAGPANGFLCFIFYAIMYKTLGIEAPVIQATLGEGNAAFVNTFCIICFVLCVIAGFLLDDESLKVYKELLKDPGYKVDFPVKYDVGAGILNIGIYGLFIVAYYNLIGAKFTGPTFGAIFCMLSTGCLGATPLNVLPIMIGYFIASRFGVFALNSQAIVVGLCFASGLAPISGSYGVIAGIVAGILHYCLVTSVPAIHGGFNLYNGGFTAALVCVAMVPVLQNYFKTKQERKLLKSDKSVK